jgi:gas vesicle protein
VGVRQGGARGRRFRAIAGPAAADPAAPTEGTTVQLDRLTDSLTEQVDRVRDRTAEAVGSDSGSVLREFTKINRKLDGIEKHLASQLDTIAELSRDTEGRLGDLEGGVGTTWPRRLFWIAVGMGAGAAAAYLADPDRGEQRREEIVGQAQQRVQSVTEDATERARAVKDEVVHRAQDVKDQAVTSAQSVADEAQHAAQDVAGEAQRAVVDVREEAEDAAEDVKQQVSSDGTAAPLTPPPGRNI